MKITFKLIKKLVGKYQLEEGKHKKKKTKKLE
jgi:hypothetical protein